MHDDDWFDHAGSLQSFADAIKNNPGISFIFSAYRNIYLADHREEAIYMNKHRFNLLQKNASTLFAKNIIGPPSVTMHRNDKIFFYDKNLKWLVDIDFYIRYLKDNKAFYIDEPLINVGIGKDQVTKEAFRMREVEIPENFYLLNKTGIGQLKNIRVYDAWWRLMRNLNIRSTNEIKDISNEISIPPAITAIIDFQKKIPESILKIGVLSKFFMFISFILFYKKVDPPNS
jgi:hypothetical protein